MAKFLLLEILMEILVFSIPEIIHKRWASVCMHVLMRVAMDAPENSTFFKKLKKLTYIKVWININNFCLKHFFQLI